MSHNKGSGFNSQRWYDVTMDKRTRDALSLRIAEYEQAHENDSDAALLDMLRARAEELGYVPYPVDCLAGGLIMQRFGSWQTALKLASLPKPMGTKVIKNSRLYQEEYRRQQKLHRREKEQKLEKRKAAEQEREQKKRDLLSLQEKSSPEE